MVAPWDYEELAKVYRKTRESAKEVAIIERYLSVKPRLGATGQQIEERLPEAKQLLEKNKKLEKGQ